MLALLGQTDLAQIQSLSFNGCVTTDLFDPVDPVFSSVKMWINNNSALN